MEPPLLPTPRLARENHGDGSPADPGPDPGRTPETEQDEGGPALVCRACGHLITREAERIRVMDSHRHVFFNPHGHVFEIGCFARAPGCAAAARPSTEFPWFPGHSWQPAACLGCLLHMGWLFTARDGAAFWGLILANLVQGGAPSP